MKETSCIDERKAWIGFSAWMEVCFLARNLQAHVLAGNKSLKSWSPRFIKEGEQMVCQETRNMAYAINRWVYPLRG